MSVLISHDSGDENRNEPLIPTSNNPTDDDYEITSRQTVKNKDNNGLIDIENPPRRNSEKIGLLPLPFDDINLTQIDAKKVSQQVPDFYEGELIANIKKQMIEDIRNPKRTVDSDINSDEEEKEGLLEDFDENFVDRVADPVAEGQEGTLCDVCYCEYKVEDFFSLKCNHSFCVNCQADHLRTKITNGQAMKLPCMQQGCKEIYTLEQIQTFCSSKIQKQYNVIKEDVRVGKSKSLKWCARPGCENVIRRPGCCCKRRAICSCGFETCFKCGDPYHEASCQVSGEAGLMMHNINPRVAKCPHCSSPVYKISGCNHMTCYRCNKDWCWICRRVTADYGAHFSPGSIFGCAGMQDVPQSIILWILLLCIQFCCTPFIIVGNISFAIGNTFQFHIRESDIIGAGFFFGVFGLPLVLIPAVICLPVVLAYRFYVLVMIVLRNFVFCCCC